MLKAEDVVTPKILCKILRHIWDTEVTPKGWKTGTIVKLPKKAIVGTAIPGGEEA